MASPSQPHAPVPVNQDTLINLKIVFDGNNRRFKLALRDLGAHVLPHKLRFLLAIPPDAQVVFERFSDSAGDYIPLDSNNPAIYKQLYRAAKAKLKLRMKATIISPDTLQTVPAPKTMDGQPASIEADKGPAPPHKPQTESRPSYLDTVLSYPSQPTAPALPPYDPYTTYRPAAFRPPSLLTVMGLNNTTTDTLVMPPVNAPTSKSTSVPNFHDYPSGSFCIDCNNCGKSIPNEHYHCSICDAGDFDLCQGCVDRGVSCDDDEHWLIKRSIKDGMVIPSVTQTIAPKKASNKPAGTEDMKESVPPNEYEDGQGAERTCNSCIRELPEHDFVSCKDCCDFDLCFSCFSGNRHGHHPGHEFEPVVKGTTKITPRIMSACGAGRGVVHQAICDGCDKNITGVRHKCLKCPDWDFCSTCVLSADQIHPGHRFAALYEPISDLNPRAEEHRGIYCDGPLCATRRRKSYIRGDRYKCAVCHDTDFCANCEAVPTHDHNKTHPLIKFKTPLHRVSITTLESDHNGEKIEQMGDRPRARNASTETLPHPPSANAATQVQTVAEVKPVELLVSEVPHVDDKTKTGTAPSDLQALFESDSTPDGTKFAPNRLVSQSWTLRNPGPQAWPAGCAVYYIGGDDMRNLDVNHPSSVSAMTSATRSNVLDQGLEPGNTAVFQVMLKSPLREGRVISYWRLKTPEGVPFGHKLWVDITVTSTPAELPEQQTASPPATPTKVAEPDSKDDDVPSQDSSVMIFPKLEKESPVSSVHDITAAPAPPVEPTIKTEVDELLEDVESLELEEEETDDGFLTDEEYDILDASDEDFLAEAQKAAQK